MTRINDPIAIGFHRSGIYEFIKTANFLLKGSEYTGFAITE